MSEERTAQEQFWAGKFGDAYAARNRGERLLSSKIALFAQALSKASRIASVLELGCNIGLNLEALGTLLPGVARSGVEINAQAAAAARLTGAHIDCCALGDFHPGGTFDLVLASGILIHVPPQDLPGVYDLMHAASARYLCLAEYYNPTPVMVEYRGHADRLFKRDFAGDLLDRFDDLRLLDYGFVYHRDPAFPIDDVTWFLLERRVSWATSERSA